MKAGSEESSTAHSQAQKEKDRAQQKLASDMSAAGLEGSSTAQSQAHKERAVAREVQSTAEAGIRHVCSWLRAKQNTSQAAQHQVRPRRKELWCNDESRISSYIVISSLVQNDGSGIRSQIVLFSVSQNDASAICPKPKRKEESVICPKLLFWPLYEMTDPKFAPKSLFCPFHKMTNPQFAQNPKGKRNPEFAPNCCFGPSTK